MGNLLKALRILRIYQDDAVHTIVTDWRFHAARGSTWRKDKEFLAGIKAGFGYDVRDSQPRSILDGSYVNPVLLDESSETDLDEECDEGSGKIIQDQGINLSSSKAPMLNNTHWIVNDEAEDSSLSQDIIPSVEPESYQFDPAKPSDKRAADLSGDTPWLQSFLGQLEELVDAESVG